MGFPTQYGIQPFINNPGFFNENLETIRTIQNHWKLVVIMDAQKLQEHLQLEKMKLDIQRIHQTCPNRSKSKNCKYMLKFDRLNEKLCQLETTNEGLLGILIELLCYYTPDSKQLSKIGVGPSRAASKRSKTQQLARKVMASDLWDSIGILSINFKFSYNLQQVVLNNNRL